MSSYPVSLAADRPARYTRVQLFVRLAALIALGMLGVSLGTFFAIAYVALPLYAASRMAALGSSRDYFREDGARIMRGIHWFLAVSAWAGLVTERLPGKSPDETLWVALEDAGQSSSPVSAVLRIFTGLLSALALCVLAWLGLFVWLWAALSVLIREQVGDGAFSYLLGLQRWCARLLAYQACLVDEYPPFTLSDSRPQLPAARATV